MQLLQNFRMLRVIVAHEFPIFNTEAVPPESDSADCSLFFLV